MTDLIADNLAARLPAPVPDCVICLHAPAAEVSFREHRGFLWEVKWRKEEGPFCCDCGLTTFREMTSRTLTQGWWSLVSPVLGPLVIVLNLLARNKVVRLGQPAADPNVVPDRKPLLPVRPVLARPRSWIGPSLFVLLIAVVLLTGRTGGSPRDEGCIQLGRDGDLFVSCAKPHDARVVGIVDDWNSCPAEAIAYVERGYRYYCWVPERR